MARKKEQPATAAENQPDKVEEAPTRRPRGYLVRFPDREARLRAIDILGEVGLPYVGVPDPVCGVAYGLMNKHIEALQREGIPYEVVG
jgi:hypothetical protein